MEIGLSLASSWAILEGQVTIVFGSTSQEKPARPAHVSSKHEF
jgi:hypothetical protein